MKQLFIVAISLFLLSAVTCNASWLIFHKPEFKGKIVDIDTNESIEGAVVVAIYRKQAAAPGDSVNVDIDAREALTDKNGEFVIPSYTTLINPLSWSNPVDFYIFKPGYACLGPADLEEEFSGSTNRGDTEIPTSWNPSLRYRILKSGVVMLPKVSGKDRIQSFRGLSWSLDLRQKLPIASEMKYNENKFILTIE
jgi:hypothetical protein